MAGFSNNMTNVLNKIERKLGTKPLNLPDYLKKERWADEVIIPETLVTYSRYFPHQFIYHIDGNTKQKNGYYYLDEDLIGDTKILGIRDLNWQNYGQDGVFNQLSAGYGIYDYYSGSYGFEDLIMMQMRADHLSAYNNGIYIDFIPPNKFKLENAVSSKISIMTTFDIIVLIEHSKSLTTISPTQMETFEDLAIADVASYLYENLKYYDNLQTVYATIDLKLSEFADKASKRDDIINNIKEGYVSAANKNQPLIICQ